MAPSQTPGPAREPISRWSLWVSIVGIILLGIPWYLPTGLIGSTYMGIPVWFCLSVASAIALSATTSYACLTQWNLEDTEDRGTTDLEKTEDPGW